jgi:anti-anti-sigma factor
LSVRSGEDPIHREHDSALALDRLASIGQIAAGIAHEVKNPLTAVKGFLQLLQAETSHRYLDFASKELENALTTLQNLLHVSKPDLEDEPFSPINLCTELEALLYLFQEKSYEIAIVKQFSNANEKIFGKRNQLKKAIFNLIKNAFEAIPERGSIIVRHYKAGDRIIFSISDTGVGIPRDKIRMLGTPFYTSKTDGTGMGLTQVFSSIYEHGGSIHVDSELGVGTTFTIHFPIHQECKPVELGVKSLKLTYTAEQDFGQFYNENREKFIESLIKHGQSIFDIIKEAPDVDEHFILNSAHRVVTLLNEENEHGLIVHAKEHGRNWARHNLELISKLEWIQMLRKVYWDFLYEFYSKKEADLNLFFTMERKVNFNLDTFLKHFSSSYTEYKNQLLQSQREVIEDLSVPVIQLSNDIAILPIIGTIDTLRAKKIQENVLYRIHQLKVKRIIIDLSAVAYMDTAVVTHLFKIVSGIAIQGCKAVMTGIRPEIANTMVELGIELHEKVETKATLQQAMEEYHIQK